MTHMIKKINYDIIHLKSSTWPYLYEISAHFSYEIKTNGYDVIGINVFLRKLMKFLRKNPE